MDSRISRCQTTEKTQAFTSRQNLVGKWCERRKGGNKMIHYAWGLCAWGVYAWSSSLNSMLEQYARTLKCPWTSCAKSLFVPSQRSSLELCFKIWTTDKPKLCVGRTSHLFLTCKNETRKRETQERDERFKRPGKLCKKQVPVLALHSAGNFSLLLFPRQGAARRVERKKNRKYPDYLLIISWSWSPWKTCTFLNSPFKFASSLSLFFREHQNRVSRFKKRRGKQLQFKPFFLLERWVLCAQML